MRKVVIVGSLLFSVLFLGGTLGRTCGDKLLVLGRGVRFQCIIPDHPASILLYLDGASPASAALGGPKFQSAIRDAGHKLQVVENRQELEQALKAGNYDILLADLADAALLEPSAQAAPSKPVLLPAVYNGTKAEATVAEKRYGCVLRIPGRTGHYLSAIDKAMELKLKRNGQKSVAHV